MKGLLSLFKSRKFILTLIPVIGMMLRGAGYDIPDETLIGLASSIAVLVIAISAEDIATKLRD